MHLRERKDQEDKNLRLKDRRRVIFKQRQEENENKKEGTMGRGLDRCCILSQQMVKLEGKRETGERNKQRDKERVIDIV